MDTNAPYAKPLPAKSKIAIAVAAAVALILVLLAGGIYFWQKSKSKTDDIFRDAGSATDKALQDAIRGTLPSVNTNAFENKPDINPAANANPIKNIKTNPFE